MQLDDRIAIVTGGANGIGRGIAAVLAQRGAHVVIADIDGQAASEVARSVEKAGRKALVVEADVSRRTSTDAMVAATLAAFGRVDILVNNAGVGGGKEWWSRTTGNSGDWDRTYAVNVMGIVHGIESVQGHMKERRQGKIVNIASTAGRRASAWFAHYSASKASAINVSQAYALRLAPFNINVNCICPGLLWTPLWEKISERRLSTVAAAQRVSPREFFLQQVKANVPLGREQTPEDVGKLTAFLVSDAARNITGQSINLNGGSVKN
ncbi:MAG: SDR family oxidoreductase [Chloroflexi bacterium]|nr:SDR family oxidoreductase [Chloroflexota bacterium]